MSEDVAQSKLPERVTSLLTERMASGAIDLPVLPDAAAEVVSRTSDPNCDFKAVAEMIRRDQAMATHLLRIANSPLYRPRTQIVSLQHALSRLGTSAVREIALLISVKTRVFQVDRFGREVKELFRHSLGTAVYAQEIARMRRWNVDEAFLSGLLHDIGRPILLQSIVDLCKELRVPVDKAAVETAATEHHAKIGSELATRWSLPGVVATTILHHHDQLEDAAQTIMLAQLGDALAHATLVENPKDYSSVRTHWTLAGLNLYPEDVDKLLALRDRVSEIVSSLA